MYRGKLIPTVHPCGPPLLASLHVKSVEERCCHLEAVSRSIEIEDKAKRHLGGTLVFCNVGKSRKIRENII